MSQTDTHSAVDHDDPLSGPTWVVGIAGTAVFVAISLAVAALLYEVQETTTATMESEVMAKPADVMRDAQRSRLEGTRRELRTENGEAEAVVIPIDQAIDLVVAELQGG